MTKKNGKAGSQHLQAQRFSEMMYSFFSRTDFLSVTRAEMARTTDPDVLCRQILTLMSRGYAWEVARGWLWDCPKESTGIICVIRAIGQVSIRPRALHGALESDWERLLYEASKVQDFNEARVCQWIGFLKDCHQLDHSRWDPNVRLNLERVEGPLAEHHDLLLDLHYQEPLVPALFPENNSFARAVSELQDHVWGDATIAYLSSEWAIDFRYAKIIQSRHKGLRNLRTLMFLYSKFLPSFSRVRKATEIGANSFRDLYRLV